jgi:hypothetical protein
MKTVNGDAFMRLAGFLERNADLYQQRTWGELGDAAQEGTLLRMLDRGERLTTLDIVECGSHCCIAGWTAVLYGWQPALNRKHHIVFDAMVKPGVRDIDKMLIPAQWNDYEGHDTVKMTSVIAAEVLGIGPDTDLEAGMYANYLFGGNARPRQGLTVAEALVQIGHGAHVMDVWDYNAEMYLSDWSYWWQGIEAQGWGRPTRTHKDYLVSYGRE